MTNNTKLLLIKTVHTLIWAFFVSAILYVLWSGITARVSVATWIAVAAVFLEGIIIFVFKGSCPLTVVARRYSDSARDNFDIFLPEWLARYNKQIFTTLFCIALALVLLRLL